jgi:hypothetical protein
MEGFLGSLPIHLSNILEFGALVGYTGPNALILLENLPTALQDPQFIDRQLEQDLALGRVVPAVPVLPYISSLLRLVPKKDGSFRRIHYLSHPPQASVNTYISEDLAAIRYTRI